MSYKIKEIYYTIQGEGNQSGMSAIFCRFTGCNLWSGREEDRLKAVCQFCDTDFVGTNGPNGGVYNTEIELSAIIDQIWREHTKEIKYKLVVFTGGEPLLQLDKKLVSSVKKYGFRVAVETNGTLDPPEGIDWLCVSPKSKETFQLKKGNELKFIYPQSILKPEDFEDLDFDYFFIQPMDNDDIEENTRKSVEYCLKNPQWRLSLQTHKILNIP